VSYTQEVMPPVEFEYSLFPTDKELSSLSAQVVDQSSLESLPIGIDDKAYRWVDLDGEGSSGVLMDQGNCWFYKCNTSASNFLSSNAAGLGDTSEHENGVSARFSGLEVISSRPSASFQSATSHFGDVKGGGNMDLTVTSSPIWGYYERKKNTWKPFRAFSSYPNTNAASPDIQYVDLTGDGLPDILDMSSQNLCWYQSLAATGYSQGINVPAVTQEEIGPILVAGDTQQIIYLADMSGDGLADIVRIRNSDVCYWPNLGYGRWGRRVQMSSAPSIDYLDTYNQKRVHLADIDGSGTTDIIYLSDGGVDIYLVPAANQLDSVHCIDLLGSGTTCLVWSSSLPHATRASMQYVDFTMGRKPHLLTRIVNNLGSET